MQSNKININTLIDEAKFTPFHWGVLFWCLMIIIFDGYDLVIYGVALPLLMQEWALSAVQAGLLASTALFGMMFGAMTFGTLSDKLGRKKTIMICVAIFQWLYILRCVCKQSSRIWYFTFPCWAWYWRGNAKRCGPYDRICA